MRGKGLLTSDHILFTDSISRPIVLSFAHNPLGFVPAFVTAMFQLGNNGVTCRESRGNQERLFYFS